MKALPRKFYERDTKDVAHDLIGKVLHFGEKQGRIIEVEAYLGAKDPASHAYGRVTDRKKIFYGPGGIAYVYLIYGLHWCLNAVTGPEGEAGCVLIQGVGEIFGPGRVTKFFGINGEHNGLDLTTGPIYISDEGLKNFSVNIGPRIGITKAVNWPLRFVAVDKV